jgi:hypothetical protein
MDTDGSEEISLQAFKQDLIINAGAGSLGAEFSDMRKLLSEVLSFTLLPSQIKDLRKEFEKMDTDESEEISLQAFKQVLIINAGAGSLGANKKKKWKGFSMPCVLTTRKQESTGMISLRRACRSVKWMIGT